MRGIMKSTLLLIAVLSAGASQPALSSMVRYDISGIVSAGVGSTALKAGDPFIVSILANLEAGAIFQLSYVSDYAIKSIDFRLPSISYQYSSSIEPGSHIRVINDPPFTPTTGLRDGLEFTVGLCAVHGPIFCQSSYSAIGTMQLDSFALDQEDPTTTAFTSTSLPTTGLSIGIFPGPNRLSIYGVNSGFLDGTIHSISVSVPEPSAYLLMSIGIGFIALRKRIGGRLGKGVSGCCASGPIFSSVQGLAPTPRRSPRM
jgi:hypothetical protein